MLGETTQSPRQVADWWPHGTNRSRHSIGSHPRGQLQSAMIRVHGNHMKPESATPRPQNVEIEWDRIQMLVAS